MLDEQQFRLKADAALERLYHALAQASEEYDFECDYDGTVRIEFEEPPAKFVVSPNAPVRQIWVSAHSRSYKLDWDDARGEFVHGETDQSLTEVMSAAVSRQVGEEVQLAG